MGLFSSIGSVWSTKHKELFEAETHDAIRLRMHRAFSWMRKAQEFEIPENADARLIFSWIGLNTLYAKWDSNIHNREPEWKVREEFLRWIVKQDVRGRIQGVILDNRKLSNFRLKTKLCVWSSGTLNFLFLSGFRFFATDFECLRPKFVSSVQGSPVSILASSVHILDAIFRLKRHF